jgi:flagellar basal-body rod protein FlgB
MTTFLDTALGLHPQALMVRARRAEVLAGNLANSDTPNYKARDVDFRAVLARAVVNDMSSVPAVRLVSTNAAHLAPEGGSSSMELAYRNPLQPSIDGNTVDPQFEYAAFAENAVQYQASLQFLSGRIRTLMTAIRGD